MYSLAIANHRALNYDGGGRSSPRLSLVPMPPDQIDKHAEFKRWLALFFIERGKYKITEKGYAELAPKVQRQNLEFGEPVSDRKREPRLEERRPLTKSEIKEAVARKVEKMLAEGRAEELYDKGYIERSYHVDWSNKEVRITVIKKFLGFLGASPARLDKLREELNELILQSLREDKTDTKRMHEILDEIRSNLERIRKITQDDFKNNGLGGLLRRHYKNSPYLALLEAGYAYSEDEIKEHARTGEFKTDKIYPWEMNNVRIYHNKKIRIAATKWLIWKLKKEPREITTDDFNNNGLKGLMNNFKSSPYLALVEADYAYSEDETKEHARTGEFKTDKIYPWEMNNVRIYHNKKIRIAATKWLIWKLKKEAKDISKDDFYNNGLGGLLRRHYKNSPYLALLEAGYAYSEEEILEHAKTGMFGTDKVYPWEMKETPHTFYKEKKNRIAATKWLIWKLKKEAKDISKDDFYNNGLGGLLPHYYKNSPYKALLEAGLVTPADEEYMRRYGGARFN